MIITPTQGQFAIIDDADYQLIAGRKWQAHKRRDGAGWYAVSDGLRMHRHLMGITDQRIVDHVNGDGLDNRRNNIRVGTQSQNCVNRRRTPGRFLRGARPKKNRWQAYIKYRGKQRSLGCFNTDREAHMAYAQEARLLHGDWMPLPAPPESKEQT